MELIELQQLSQELQIAPEFVLREYWELLILQAFSQSLLANSLIFKGGTALRLAYNSPRFSEDLDFDISKEIKYKDFQKFIDNFLLDNQQIAIKDIARKYYTIFAKLIIKEPALPRNFSIKIEISTRKNRSKKYFENRLITSPVTILQALMPVVTLENIRKEKKQALSSRRQARDVYDLWFITQLERKPWLIPKHEFTKKQLKQELGKFLPKKERIIIDQLVYEK